MSRPVSTAHGTALAETLTRPLYLVELGFPVPVRLSSRETTTWNSLLWTAASFRIATGDLGNETQAGKPMSALRAFPRVLAAGGGQVIESGGVLLGGIGVMPGH